MTISNFANVPLFHSAAVNGNSDKGDEKLLANPDEVYSISSVL